MADNDSVYISIDEIIVVTVEQRRNNVALAVEEERRDGVDHDGEDTKLQAFLFYEHICLLQGIISGHGEEMYKLLNYHVGIHGAIISAIFPVQTVNKKMHCATWWTVPILAATASGGIIVAIVVNLFRQCTTLLDRQRSARLLTMLLDSVLDSIQGAPPKSNNPNLLFSMQSLRMKVNLNWGLSVRFWCAQRAAFLVDIAYPPFVERFSGVFGRSNNYDIETSSPKLLKWIQADQDGASNA